MITVYSLPNCPGCVRTKSYLEERSVEYREVNIMDDPDAQSRLKAMGYSRAPVVEAGDQHWSGHQPERLAELAT